MIKDILRVYLLDILMTIASFCILFSKWEDNISAIVAQIMKWTLVLFLWSIASIPALFDLGRTLTQNGIKVTGEVLQENSSNKGDINTIEILDRTQNTTLHFFIMNTSLSEVVKGGDIVTVDYLPHRKYGKIIEVFDEKEGLE